MTKEEDENESGGCHCQGYQSNIEIGKVLDVNDNDTKPPWKRPRQCSYQIQKYSNPKKQKLVNKMLDVNVYEMFDILRTIS